MSINKASLDLIKEFEGLRLNAYDLEDGTITIGYGATQFRHPEIHRGMRITEKQAEDYLKEDLKTNGRMLAPYVNDLNANQYGALVSMCHNLGNFIAQYPSIGQAIKRHDWKYVTDSMMNFVMPGTRFQEGLTRRRRAEVKLFNTPTSERTNGSSTPKKSPVPVDADKYTKELYRLGGGFKMGGVFYLDEVKKVNGIWQVVNYDLAGRKKDINWNNSGIPCSIITVTDKYGTPKKNQDVVNPGMFAIFDDGWDHGTIDAYGKTSVGIDFGKYGRIWFNSKALLYDI